MPDAWSYKDSPNDVRNPLWTFKAKAERENPGLIYVRRERLTTGLWCDVTMRTADFQFVTRRLFF